MACDGLPTCVRLAAKGVDVIQNCPLCDQYGEDSKHLFLSCPFTIGIMDKIHAGTAKIVMTQNDPNKGIREIIADICRKLGTKEMEDLTMIWWCIWHQRNKTLFDNASVLSTTDLVLYIKAQVLGWNTAKILGKADEIRAQVNKRGINNNKGQRRGGFLWTRTRLK